jgi:transcriptional regulator
MHPAAFHVDDREACWPSSAHPFVTIAAAVGGRPFTAQVPVVIRELDFGEVALDFHLSRGNALAPHLVQGFRAVALATGPDAYVSPDWYGSDDQVPTWNYVSAEAEGSVAPLDATSSSPCSTTSRPRKRRVSCPRSPGPATR